jgi:asparagine synthase (glutamine-hydrolysing)
MCGICGHLAGDMDGQGDALAVSRMTAALAHRGPDGAGFYAEGPIALGHRRLAIVDLSPRARQPLANEDGQVVCVVNGEIYNHDGLRRLLEMRGHRFHSRSDSEVVVHLYEEYGEEFVHALRGMFALAVWDARTRRLVLARDRAGEKPLYYAVRRDGFRFASEAAALVAGLPEPPAVDLDAIARYLTLQYVPAPATAFADIEKLPAAHRLVVTPGAAPRVERYWKLHFVPGPPVDEREAIAEVRSLFDEAIRMREVADVPVGAFLSGGIDSSAVVAAMARHSDSPVRTFSIAFDQSSSEGSYAREVAARWRTEHHELTVQPDMVHILPELVRRHGEPFADTSAVPTFYLSQLARRHVTVALSGDGGDEVFGGYTRYALDRVSRGIERLFGRATPAFAGLLSRLPGARLDLVRAFGAHLGLSRAERYLFLVAHFTRAERERVLGPRLRDAQCDVIPWFESLLAASDARDPTNRLLDLDTQTYLPDDIFTKVDIASMAHGLEVRAPLVDHFLMEHMASLPARLKLRGLRGKYLFRRAVADSVPRSVVRRRKRGFSLPIDAWFRGPLRELAWDILTDRTTRVRGLLDEGGVISLLESHQRGASHGERLWNLVVLELWHREFIDRPAARSLDSVQSS